MERADLRLENSLIFADAFKVAKELLTKRGRVLLDDMSGGVLATIVELGVNATHLILQFIFVLLGCTSGLPAVRHFAIPQIFITVWAALSSCAALLLLTHAHVVLCCW